MPNKYEFEQIIVSLEEAINCFKKSQRRFNEYKIYLSNGKVLEFTFDDKNIPHLLGINIGNLKTSKILSSDKPFEMLEELIERYTAIYQKMKRGEIQYKDIFSPYIKEKAHFFKLIFNFHTSNILGVCRYSPINSYLNGDTNTYGCDYYIIFDDDENFPYFLGLKEDRINDYYAPSSVIGNFDETGANNSLKSIISNQQIMLVNNVFRTNTGEKYYVTNAEKYVDIPAKTAQEGDNAWRRGDYDEARTRYGEAAKLYDINEDYQGEAQVLGRLGEMELSLDNYEASEKALRAAGELVRDVPDAESTYGDGLIKLAKLYTAQYQLGKALEIIKQAEDVLRDDGSRNLLGDAYDQEAYIHMLDGQEERALAAYRAAAKTFEAEKITLKEASVLRAMARIEMRRKNYDEAHELLENCRAPPAKL